MKRVLRVYKKTVSVIDEAPTEMYENLAGAGRGFLLESYDKNYDMFTLFGAEPEEVITSEGNSLVITKADSSRQVREGNPHELLKEYYDEFEIRKDNNELAFSGGLVGNLGYDYIRYTEKLPDANPDTIGIGTIQMMLMTRFIVVDHVSETMTAVVLDEDSVAGRARALCAAASMLEKARTPSGNRAGGSLSDSCPPRRGGSRTGCPPGADRRGAETAKAGKHSGQPCEPGSESRIPDGHIVRETDTLEEYSEKVERIRHYIREGHVFQTVLSQRWTVETGQDGFSLYKTLREKNPSPYLYYYNYGGFEVIGSSPEMIVKQQGERVYTCPIAGTRRRGATKEEDLALTEELLSDEKELAEHVMLVDLARNDTGRVSEFGTVKLTEFMKVQYYSHVMHIVSLVEGRKKGICHPLDLVASFLPAGTLSGAPKIRAMEIIDELETVRRGLYGGATGYVDFSGDMDFCITIRTMVKKGRNVYLQAGAGIVADSQPASEYEECRNKVMALAGILVPEEDL